MRCAHLALVVAGMTPSAYAQAPGLPQPPEVALTRPQRNAEGLLLLKLGERILAEGAYEIAARVLRRATEVLPDLPFPYVALATALLKAGRDLDGAEVALERALALAPANAAAHAQVALLKELRGDREGALLSYREAVRLRPADAELQERLGRAALEAGEEGAAVAAFEEALRLSARSALALSNLAILYEKRGKLDHAEWALRHLVRLEPKRWPYWARLAAIYDKLRRPADAERARAEVRRLNPPSAPQRTDLRPLKPVKGAPRSKKK